MNEPIALFDTLQSTAQQRKILYIVRVITSRGHRGHQSERKKTEINPRGISQGTLRVLLGLLEADSVYS